MDGTIGFTLREIAGQVNIAYGINDDPVRWGFNLLGMDMDIDLIRGFPILEARVRYPAEGYAAFLGWIQGVSYTAKGEKTVWYVPDVAPQARDANTPYTNFGTEPVFFDAPATDDQNVEFHARCFLAHTPDCLMTPVVEPICGFTWGFDVEDGTVRPREVKASLLDDWIEIRRLLRIRLPTWTFGGDAWKPPALEPAP